MGQSSARLEALPFPISVKIEIKSRIKVKGVGQRVVVSLSGYGETSKKARRLAGHLRDVVFF